MSWRSTSASVANKIQNRIGFVACAWSNRLPRMSNVLSFPKKPLPRASESPAMAPYEFACEELAVLCRWYSAMKFAFPRLQGVMTVCREDRVSAIGLYGDDGCSPNCLISKHETDGQVILLWATDHDRPRTIGAIREIADAQILAIA